MKVILNGKMSKKYPSILAFHKALY